MKRVEPGSLGGERKALVEAAIAALDHAYCPYSGFQVGAALRAAGGGGQVFSAANLENASYGLTLCAERAALARANAEGERNFAAIAVVARRADGSRPALAAPCGACRQMLYEAVATGGGGDIEVILAAPDLSEVVTTTVRALLPHPFGPGFGRPGPADGDGSGGPNPGGPLHSA